MESQFELFEKILKRLHEVKALNSLILIGSWCLPLYRKYYDNAPEIPALRTHDLDFFSPRPKMGKSEIPLPKLFEELGFDLEIDPLDGGEKFVEEDLEVEFIAPITRQGRGAIELEGLGVKGQALGYLEKISKYTMVVEYVGTPVVLPELASFVLHKALIQPIRNDKAKAMKDASTVLSLSELILERFELSERFATIYFEFPKKWQKQIKGMLEKEAPELLKLIK